MPWRARLPHQPPARLVCGVTQANRVLLDSSRGLDRWQLLEGCAQALAVFSDGTTGGRLAALTAVRFIRPAETHALVTVEGSRGIGTPALQQWRVIAHDERGPLLTGVLTIAVAPLPPDNNAPTQPTSQHSHECDPVATAAAIDDYFPADLPMLAGHFRDTPLIPGVYLLALLERHLGRCATGVTRAKFLHPVYPEERLTVTPGRILRGELPVCVATLVTNSLSVK